MRSQFFVVFTTDKSIFDQFFTKKKFFFVKEIIQEIDCVRSSSYYIHRGMTKMTVFWLEFRLDNFFLDLVNLRFSLDFLGHFMTYHARTIM